MGGEIAVSEQVSTAAQHEAAVAIAVPYRTPQGRRVFSGTFSPTATPLDVYFDSTVPVIGGGGVLLDRSGDLLAGGDDLATRPSEVRAAADGVSQLDVAGESVTAAAVAVEGTPWRVVLAAPSGPLHAPVQKGRWEPWILVAVLAGSVLLALRLLQRLDQARAQAGRTARTDPLTGLPNRRALDEQLEEAAAHSARHADPLSVLMADLDGFKAVNDAHGHEVGDLLLQEVAALLDSSDRASDTTGRWGGEEFLALLPTTDLAGAVEVAERLRLAVMSLETLSGREARPHDGEHRRCPAGRGRAGDHHHPPGGPGALPGEGGRSEPRGRRRDPRGSALISRGVGQALVASRCWSRSWAASSTSLWRHSAARYTQAISPAAVHPAEVAVDEGVPGLGLVVGALGEPEVPVGVLLPGVGLEVGVLVLGGRLHVTPVAVEHVLAGVDQLAGVGDGLRVDGVGGHPADLPPDGVGQQEVVVRGFVGRRRIGGGEEVLEDLDEALGRLDVREVADAFDDLEPAARRWPRGRRGRGPTGMIGSSSPHTISVGTAAAR